MTDKATDASDKVKAAAKAGDWTRPWAMAVPKEGYFELEKGRYGPLFPKTPANYGFTIIAKIKPGREETVRAHGQTIQSAIADNPDALAVLKLHYLRWLLFPHRRRHLLHVPGVLRHRLRQVHGRRRNALLLARPRHHLHEPRRASPRTGRRTPTPSSSSCASTITRASSNMANIHSSRRKRSRRR